MHFTLIRTKQKKNREVNSLAKWIFDYKGISVIAIALCVCLFDTSLRDAYCFKPNELNTCKDNKVHHSIEQDRSC